MLPCFWNRLYPQQQKCRDLVHQRLSTKQPRDPPRSLEVALPAHQAGDLGATTFSFPFMPQCLYETAMLKNFLFPAPSFTCPFSSAPLCL